MSGGNGGNGPLRDFSSYGFEIESSGAHSFLVFHNLILTKREYLAHEI